MGELPYLSEYSTIEGLSEQAEGIQRITVQVLDEYAKKQGYALCRRGGETKTSVRKGALRGFSGRRRWRTCGLLSGTPGHRGLRRPHPSSARTTRWPRRPDEGEYAGRYLLCAAGGLPWRGGSAWTRWYGPSRGEKGDGHGQEGPFSQKACKAPGPDRLGAPILHLL